MLGPSTTKRWAYAVSKLYDEHLALALADERGLKVTILRLFNVYGPRNHLTWWGGPTVTFIESLLERRADRDPRRRPPDAEFTYVRDTVDGFVRALETPESRGEVVNVGGDGHDLDAGSSPRRSRRCSASHSRCGRPSSRTNRSRGSTRTCGTGFRTRRRRRSCSASKPGSALEEGLERTIGWHREQRRTTGARPRRSRERR